jgi:hypothetical protein
MEYYPVHKIGFEFTDENMNYFLDWYDPEEYEEGEEPQTARMEWESKFGDFSCNKAYSEFEMKFMDFIWDYLGEDCEIRSYEWRKGGYIQGLSGFQYDATYLTFEAPEDGDKRLELCRKLEERFGLPMVEATYSELG